jgi:Acetyltransferase (GNAT) domain
VGPIVQPLGIAFTNVRADTSDFEVSVASSISDVERLRPWWFTWQCHPGSDIDYFLHRLREAPGKEQPYVIAVRRNGTLDCFLIGVLKEGLSALGPVGLPLPPGRELVFLTQGFLGNQSSENAEILVLEVLKRLRQGVAEIALFHDLPEDSDLYAAVTRIPGALCRDHAVIRRAHRYLVLPPTFQDYLRELSPKERSNIRSQAKRLASGFGGRIQVRRFRDNEVDGLLEEIETISAKSYQRELGRGYTTDKASLLRLDAQKHALRAYVLYLANKPCAFLTAAFYKGRLHGRFIAYDPKYRQYSPGRYLLVRFIEDCYRHGDGGRALIIDPGGGGQQYKRSFSNHETKECCVAVYALTPKGLSLNVLRTSLLCGIHAARLFLAKTGLGKHAWGLWRAWKKRTSSLGLGVRPQLSGEMDSRGHDPA